MIVFLTILLASIYMVNFFFVSNNVALPSVSGNPENGTQFIQQHGGISALLGVLFFTYITEPTLLFIMNIFMTILWLVNGMILVSYLKEVW